MPSVSKAQRRKMAQLLKDGEITEAQFEHFKVIKKKPKKKKK